MIDKPNSPDKPRWWGDSKHPSLTPSHDPTADEQAQLAAHNAKDYLETARKSAEHAARVLQGVLYSIEPTTEPFKTQYRIRLEHARTDWLRADAELQAAERAYGRESNRCPYCGNDLAKSGDTVLTCKVCFPYG